MRYWKKPQLPFVPPNGDHTGRRRADSRAASADGPTTRVELSLSGGRPMIWFRRNRVALTILMGLALISLFAVTQSGVAILAIARFAVNFNQIAETNLPALIAASQLSELSQTLVATAPEIALADTQLRRQTIADQLNERVTAVAGNIQRRPPAPGGAEEALANPASIKTPSHPPQR